MSGTIKIKKDDLWKYAAFVFAALVVVLIVVMMNNNASTTGNVVTQNPTPTTGQQLPAKVAASVGDSPFLGNENAQVVVMEFSDYECPFCKRHSDQTVPSLKAEYVDSGKVKYVFKDFTPTLVNPSYHPNAIPAAVAARCVQQQGGDYWAMHDKIFENQGRNAPANLKEYAKTLGYNIDACLDSEATLSGVEADFALGQQVGIAGTPGFLIGSNGQYRTLSGACPYSAFKQAIDAELTGKEWYSPGNCQVVVN